MKIIKYLTTIAIVATLALPAWAQNTQTAPDTIELNYGQTGKIMVIVQDKSSIKDMAKIDIQKILLELDSASVQLTQKQKKQIEQKMEETGGYQVKLKDTTIIVNQGTENQAIEKIYKVEVKGGNYNVTIKDNQSKKPALSDSAKQARLKAKQVYPKNTMQPIFDFGPSIFMTNQGKTVSDAQPYALDMGRSWYIGFGLKHQLQLFKNALYVDYGSKFAWYNFRFNSDYSPANLGGQTVWLPYNFSNSGVASSKLTLSTFQVPVNFNFVIGHNGKTPPVMLSVGAYAGYAFQNYTKVEANNNATVKRFDDFNINPLFAGVTAQIGLAKINKSHTKVYTPVKIFVDYQLTPLFAQGKGPNVTPLTFGLRFF